MSSNAVFAGGLAILVGAMALGVLGAGWMGWLRRKALVRKGAAQQAFAGGFLGGPAFILLGVFSLRASGGAHPPIPAIDLALLLAALVLVVAATVFWNWKPRWLEPSWVRRERDNQERHRLDELKRRFGIDDGWFAPPAAREDEDLTGRFGVEGFDSLQGYEAREPTWGEDLLFPSEDEAVLSAMSWLAERGSEAQVEIHHFVSNKEAEVVAWVTQGGVERPG